MQRRLTSSIYAIKNTLEKRYKALDELAILLHTNPSLFNKKILLDDENADIEDFDQYDGDIPVEDEKRRSPISTWPMR